MNDRCPRCGAEPLAPHEFEWSWRLYATDNPECRSWKCGSVAPKPGQFRQHWKCRIVELEAQVELLRFKLEKSRPVADAESGSGRPVLAPGVEGCFYMDGP